MILRLLTDQSAKKSDTQSCHRKIYVDKASTLKLVLSQVSEALDDNPLSRLELSRSLIMVLRQAFFWIDAVECWRYPDADY